MTNFYNQTKEVHTPKQEVGIAYGKLAYNLEQILRMHHLGITKSLFL